MAKLMAAVVLAMGLLAGCGERVEKVSPQWASTPHAAPAATAGVNGR